MKLSAKNRKRLNLNTCKNVNVSPPREWLNYITTITYKRRNAEKQ